MVTTSKAYKGMRAFVDALESLQTSGLYRVTSQRPRQSGLRLPLHRSTFATTSAAEPFFTSSKSAVSSTGIGKPSAKTTKHRLPNKAPPLDPKRRERANTSHKPESNPDNPITEEEGKGPTALHTSHSAKSWGRMKGSARKSSVDHRAQSANPNPSQQLLKQDFVDDWFFGVVKEKGWLPTRSFIPPAEGSIGQFDYHLSRPDAAESWKVSVWEDTEVC